MSSLQAPFFLTNLQPLMPHNQIVQHKGIVLMTMSTSQLTFQSPVLIVLPKCKRGFSHSICSSSSTFISLYPSRSRCRVLLKNRTAIHLLHMVASDKESTKRKPKSTGTSDADLIETSDGGDSNQTIETPPLDDIDNSNDDDDDNNNNDNNDDNNNNNDNNSNSRRNDGEDDDEGEDSSSNEQNRVLGFVNDGMNHINQAVQTSQTFILTTTTNISTTLSFWIAVLLKTVPAPVLVSLITLTSTFFGSRYKAARDAKQEQIQRQKHARQRKNQIENELREIYDVFAGPILKSGAKLAERMEFLVNADWSSVEANDKDCKDRSYSPLYSAYMLGRFLAHVEILKRERPLLDYGFPTADRILANILGRIQGVLCANDRALFRIQMTEQFFKPHEGSQPIQAGVLQISPKKQTVLGELMLRHTWDHTYPDIIRKPVNKSITSGSKAVLSFLEFSYIYKDSKIMKQWFKHVVSDFDVLENSARKAHIGFKNENKRKGKLLGSRIYILQSALLDLVEFFDPLPHPTSIPIYQRNRINIGPNSYSDTMRSPTSLRKLYAELANFREHRQHTNLTQRLSLPNNGVEIFITGPITTKDVNYFNTSNCSSKEQLKKHGNCPWSHRVLIALREMNVPYHTISISPNNKPNWYYLLHPITKTPLVYYNGNVISESSNIISYLIETFKDPLKYKQLGSANNLKLVATTSTLVKFHDCFIKWLQTNEKESRIQTENELKKLNKTLQYAQKVNAGAPFLGGEVFSREDTAIVPFLHCVEVAGRRMKHWSFPQECDALRKYLEAARQMPSFIDSGAEEEAVLSRIRSVIKYGNYSSARLVLSLE